MRRAAFIAFWVFFTVWCVLYLWTGGDTTSRDDVVVLVKNARFAALSVCIGLFGYLFATRGKSR